jgi:phage prohead protease, HK97 family
VNETKNTVCKISFNFDKKSHHRVEGYFSGYASIFDEVDSQNDRVVRGAFTRSLACWQQAARKPKMLWQHQEEHVIGIWRHLQEDTRGLYVEGSLLLDVAKAKEAFALIKEQALDGLSIGYQIKQAIKGTTPRSVRLLTDVDLLEISLVTFPANPLARILAVNNAAAETIRA